MSKIMKTTDYSMFSNHENNRTPEKADLRKLRMSILSNNMLEFKPIIVDKNYKVIDGNHRLTIAREENLEIYYQIQDKEPDPMDIILLNANQKLWALANYVDYHCSLGNRNFLQLREFAAKHNIKMHSIARILPGNRDTVSLSLKDGSFVFPNKEHMDEVEDRLGKISTIIEDIKTYSPQKEVYMYSSKLRHAISMLLEREETNYDLLRSRIKLRIDVVRGCSSVHGYYAMLVGIYNYRNQNPIQA